MSFRLLILAFVVAQSLPGCTSPLHRNEKHHFDTCVAGQECTVRGRLVLHAGQPAWAALLVAGNDCAKLALPDSFYIDADKWGESEVVVTGRAFKQPSFDESDGTVTLWYTEKERKLAMGMCDDGIGVYVESMRSSAGRSWPP